MTVRGSSTNRPALSVRSYKGGTTAESVTPSLAEWWYVYIVLVAAAVIAGLSQKYNVPSQTMVQIFWSAAYLVAGWQLMRMRTQVLPLLLRHGALWALIMLLFLSTLWSLMPNTTIIGSIELLGTTLIGIYIATRFTLTDFLWVVSLAFATIGLVSVVVVFGNPGLGRANWGTGPWQGIFDDKNISGAMESLAIISQIVLLPIVRGGRRWLLVFGLALAGLLLLESNSATAFGDCAFVVVATVSAFACRSRRFGGFARFATILGVAVAFVSVFVFGMNMDSIFAALGRSGDLTTRADFWPMLGQAIADRPLLGYGFDAFFQSPLARDYLAAFLVQAGGWTPYHAHDSYLQTLLNVGYVGLAILVVLLLTSLWKAIVYFVREESIIGVWPLAIILFLTIGSYTETYYLNYNSLEWILFVVAIVYPSRSLHAPAATVGPWKRSDRL